MSRGTDQDKVEKGKDKMIQDKLLISDIKKVSVSKAYHVLSKCGYESESYNVSDKGEQIGLSSRWNESHMLLSN